jgi:hypothetical protein
MDGAPAPPRSEQADRGPWRDRGGGRRPAARTGSTTSARSRPATATAPTAACGPSWPPVLQVPGRRGVQGHNHVYERTSPLIYDAATNSAKSSKQAVAVSPAEPAQVEPAKDGTTYLTVGTAGTPRYAWAGGAGETDRNFAAGKGSGSTVTADAKAGTGAYVSELDFSYTLETVDWSQVRYADYGFVALDVTPAPRGTGTTMVLRFINEQGRELDRVVFSRTAGAGLRH